MKAAAYRVRYNEGQRLRAAELNAEQGYLVALERRHNLLFHGPGVVLGLDPSEDLRKRNPGLAIDFEGRAVVLEQRRSSAQPPEGQCIDSWLVPCEKPHLTRRSGMNECRAFDRLVNFVQLVDVPVGKNESPIPPVTGAVYLGRTHRKPDRTIPYTFLAAAQVADARGDMIMRVGPETGNDRNGFLVFKIGEVNPRLAIDRFGSTRFYGDVTLSGYRVGAHILLPKQQMLIVEASRARAAEQNIQIRIVTPTPTSVQLDFLTGANQLAGSLALDLTNDIGPAIRAFQSKLPGVSLKNVATVQTAPADPPRTLALQPCDGALLLRSWPAVAEAVSQPLRGCVPPVPSDAPAQEPNGLSFEPLPATPRSPSLPGFYTVQTGDAAQPAQEFRLDLGEKVQNDQSDRLSIGIRGESAFNACLVATGTGTFKIPLASKADPPVTLQVLGKIERAPIKPDPTDPLFNSLLISAWFEGVRSTVAASTVIDLALKDLKPLQIETGVRWSYTLTITNRSNKSITADGQEIQTVTGPRSFTRFKPLNAQLSIPVGESRSYTVEHDSIETTAGTLSLQLRVFGKIGNTAWWNSQTFGPFTVAETPLIDFRGFPDSVPPGAPWDWQVVIANVASIPLTLTSAKIREESDPPDSLVSVPVSLQPGDVSRSALKNHTGISKDRTFTVEIAFTWPNDTKSTLAKTQIVHVFADLDAVFSIPDSVEVGHKLKFDLRLGNQSKEAVTLVGLKYILTSADFPDQGGSIILPTTPSIAPGKNIKFRQLETIAVPAPVGGGSSTELRIALEVKYKRGVRSFEPERIFSDEITIV